MNDLKPCPFCGGEATLQKEYFVKSYFVCCLNDNCCMPETFREYSTEEEAIEAWNRRVNDGSTTY